LPKYSFPSDLIDIRGAAEIRSTPHGAVPHRLPAWAERQIPDDLMRFDAAAAAGVHVVFDTEATLIELDAVFTRFENERSGQYPTCIELVVDGVLVDSVAILEGPILRFDDNVISRVVPGERSSIRFAELAIGMKQVEIWLPHAASVELLSLATDVEIRPSLPDARPRWIHYGSSISHCMETSAPTTTWPAIAARQLGLTSLNLGFAGEAMLDPFVAKVIRDSAADLITLKLGVNVVGGQSLSPRSFLTATHGYLDTIRERHPTAPIVVISAIHCPLFENAPDDLALTIPATREILAQVVAARSNDANLHFLDGRRLLGRDDEALLPDDLHPNTAGYGLMAERFAEYAIQMNFMR
jgi:lysophospholipase L1-like esterase